MSTPALLTAHLFVFGEHASAAARQESIATLVRRLEEREIHAVVRSYDIDPRDDSGLPPSVYVTIGGVEADYPALFGLPLFERRRWLHFDNPEVIDPASIFYCWLAATDPLPNPQPMALHALSTLPLVSVFTAAYRSGTRIRRPFHSLLAQTYQNWEWVVMDDSGDDDVTYREHLLPLDDRRIRKYRQDKRSGYIGTVKRVAAGLCTGEILVELDHDDVLTPDCLQRLVDALQRHPDCGFAFGEAAEVYEETLESRWYGWDAGFGYLTYWRQHDRVTNRCQDVPRTASTNWQTVRHLIGLPNHPRAWTRECYFLIGGHRVGLSVADDYDLLIRTFLSTRFVRVQHLLYLQYVNAGGSNQTQQRNAQIQAMCAEIEHYYRPQIDKRLTVLGMPSLADAPYRRIWTCPEDGPRWRAADIVDVGASALSSFLFIVPFGDAQVVMGHLLNRMQECEARDWQRSEIVVVGNVPVGLIESASAHAPAGAIRWWITEPEWTLEDCTRYGRVLCTGSEVIELGAAQREAAPAPPQARTPLSYTIDFVLTAPADRHRDRLSVLRHLQQHFEYRRFLEIGCDRDEVFAQMIGFELKVGIDPRAGGTHRVTSDAYFEANRARPAHQRDNFDLVLVDGLHECVQVLRDVENALACLAPGGAIVLHDCMPFSEHQQIMPRPVPMSFWTGDVWKALVALRQRADIDIAVGRFDWGVGVLRVRPNANPIALLQGEYSMWTWADYCNHRDEALNAMGYDALLRWIDGKMD